MKSFVYIYNRNERRCNLSNSTDYILKTDNNTQMTRLKRKTSRHFTTKRTNLTPQNGRFMRKRPTSNPQYPPRLS